MGGFEAGEYLKVSQHGLLLQMHNPEQSHPAAPALLNE